MMIVLYILGGVAIIITLRYMYTAVQAIRATRKRDREAQQAWDEFSKDGDQN